MAYFLLGAHNIPCGVCANVYRVAILVNQSSTDQDVFVIFLG